MPSPAAREVTRKEEPRLYNLLENLCISRGIPMPKLKIMDEAALNAFASGLNEKQYAITVTTGLLERLDDAEVEAVLGHELTHIRNGDVRMLVIAARHRRRDRILRRTGVPDADRGRTALAAAAAPVRAATAARAAASSPSPSRSP